MGDRGLRTEGDDRPGKDSGTVGGVKTRNFIDKVVRSGKVESGPYLTMSQWEGLTGGTEARVERPLKVALAELFFRVTCHIQFAG